MPALRALLGLCLLRQGPQDLPFAPSLTWAWLSALLALQWLVARHAGLEAFAILARLGITLALLVGVTRALLQSRGLVNRAEQTIAAFAGTGLVFAGLVLPIALALQGVQPGSEPDAGQFLLALTGLFLFFWKLRIDAHIWQQALDLKRGAMWLAVGLMLLEVILVTAVTGATTPTEPASP